VIEKADGTFRYSPFASAHRSPVLGGSLLPMLGASIFYRAARGLYGAAPAGSAPGSSPDVAPAP
jgi:hypothetical protein